MLLFCIQNSHSQQFSLLKKLVLNIKRQLTFTERLLSASMLFESDLLTWDFHGLQLVSVTSLPSLLYFCFYFSEQKQKLSIFCFIIIENKSNGNNGFKKILWENTYMTDRLLMYAIYINMALSNRSNKTLSKINRASLFLFLIYYFNFFF